MFSPGTTRATCRARSSSAIFRVSPPLHDARPLPLHEQRQRFVLADRDRAGSEVRPSQRRHLVRKADGDEDAAGALGSNSHFARQVRARVRVRIGRPCDRGPFHEARTDTRTTKYAPG